MNYKKGLTRIFVIGLFLAPLVGLYKEGESITKIQMIMWDVQQRMIKNMTDPSCLVIVKANPTNFSDIDPKHSCNPLGSYWDVVKSYQQKSGNSTEITAKVVEDAMDEYIDSKGSKLRWEYMGLYLAGYLVLCLSGLIIFFILRWVARGFKA